MTNEVQGNYKLELAYRDYNRVYLNFWDSIHGNDVCCQIKDGKLMKFKYLESEIEADEDGKLDHLEMTEISLAEFVELVTKSIQFRENETKS